jgi:hypothetical protein
MRARQHLRHAPKDACATKFPGANRRMTVTQNGGHAKAQPPFEILQ